MTSIIKIVMFFVISMNLSAQNDGSKAEIMMPKKNIDTELLNDLVEQEINFVRSEHGLSTLIHIDYFRTYASQHSKIICDKQKPEHSKIEDDERISGECIDMRAKMGFDDKTYGAYAKEIVQGWMDSPDHRDIILTDELTEFGVGIAEGFYKYSGFKMNAVYSTLVVN